VVGGWDCQKGDADWTNRCGYCCHWFKAPGSDAWVGKCIANNCSVPFWTIEGCFCWFELGALLGEGEGLLILALGRPVKFGCAFCCLAC